MYIEMWHATESGGLMFKSPRSPFSLLLGKSVGTNNFWLRQFKIVGVGATIGSSVGASLYKGNINYMCI